eukprot:jgi/Chlat1/7562/Chrsp63S07058
MQENGGPGAARNLAAKHAKGEYLMFMDDDNIAKPHELSTFVGVAERTGADVLTCCNDYFYGDDPPKKGAAPAGRWVPLGAAKTVGMFQNYYGDTNHLIRRTAFMQVGGFPSDAGYALEDHELFSRAVLSSHRLALLAVPDCLYHYRLRAGSHSRNTPSYYNRMRTMRPYLESEYVPRHLHYLARFAQGVRGVGEEAREEARVQLAAGENARRGVKALAGAVQKLCATADLGQESRNLVENSGFEVVVDAKSDGGNVGAGIEHNNMPHIGAKGWRTYEQGYTVDTTHSRANGVHSIKMTNVNGNDVHGATQQASVMLYQTSPEPVVVSGWSRAQGVSGHNKDAGYALYVDITYNDGSRRWAWSVEFTPGTHGWEMKEGVIEAGELPISSLQVYAMFRYHTGTVWFDDIAVANLNEGVCDYAQLLLEGLKQPVRSTRKQLI